MSKADSNHSVSYGWVRGRLQVLDKHEHRARLLNDLIAVQDIRPIGRLHSNWAGFRTELDHTKYAEFLFPAEDWNEPLLYYTGFGVDDHSTAIKGFTHAAIPSTRDIVRLYRRCVLPKSMWLPEECRRLAADWDAYGLEVMVVIDHGADFTSHASSLMFLANGTIILRVPVRRGDLKGTIERTHLTVETQHISTSDGFVPRQFTGLDPRYKAQRERARSKAKYTVAQRQAMLAEYVVSNYNAAQHPQLKKSRIQVFRDSQEAMPLIIPTGIEQLRSTFALTFETSLLREGVEADSLKFNSEELGLAFRTYTGKVIVKMDPDDVRQVLVLVPKWPQPIDAFLTTFNIPFPMSLELLKVLQTRLQERADDGDDSWIRDPDHALLTEYERLRGSGGSRTPGRTVLSDADAATLAASGPPVPAQVKKPLPSIDDLLGGSRIGDE